MRSKKYRFGAAVALAAVLAIPSAGFASADPGDPSKVGGVSQAAANPALINPDATVQLNIHKYLGTPTGPATNGTAQTNPTLPPLEGVVFDIYKVEGVDLTTSAGWAIASTAFTVSEGDIDNGSITIGSGTYNLTKVRSTTTNTAGVGVFTETDGVALYVVDENLAASTAIKDNGTPVASDSVTPAAPFAVALPMTNPAGTGWMYDVYVYPKSQSDSITKSVVDKGALTTDNGNAGSHAIDYTLTSTITRGATGVGTYVIFDQLDPALTFVSAALKLSDETPLVAETDYVLTSDSNLVRIVFTPAGIAKLDAAAAGAAKVVTTISTTVGAQDVDGIVANKASFVPNAAWWAEHGTGANPAVSTAPLGIESVGVETRFGNIVVNNLDANGAVLTGAEFQLYRDGNADGICGADDVVEANLIATSVIAANTPAFPGLQVSNYYNGTQPQQSLITYCVIETDPAAGYLADDTVHAVTIDFATGTATAPAFATLPVTNQKASVGNNLPLTGGAGVAGMSLIALVLVGGGVGYYGVTRSRDKKRSV